MSNVPKILVLGGGFAGVSTALELSKLLPHAATTLISKSDYHCFVPDLYEIATAIVKEEKRLDFKQLSGTVNIPLINIFRKSKTKLVTDEVVKIDLEKQTVNTTNENFTYDYLAICLGSTTNYQNIKDAQNFSHPLKTTEDSLNIRNDIDELINRSKDSISVVIAGGGFTGTELAAELAGFLSKLSRLHNKFGGSITILQSSPYLLPEMPEWARKEALKRLESLNIKVLINHKIKSVKEREILCENRQRIQFDYLIWTTGVKGSFDNFNGIKLTPRGQINVTENLNIENFPNVFVAGDLAEFENKKENLKVPQTAWVAVKQGKTTACNIASLYLGRELQKYSPPNPIFIVPLGKKFALSNIFGLKIKGLSVWVLKRSILLKYLLSIFPLNKSLAMWARGIIIYTRND